MLNGSILGTLYRFWTHSAVFSLLQRLWRAIVGAARGSALRRIVFGPSRLDAWFSRSVFARFFRAILNGITAVLRAIVGAIRGSAICGFFAPAFRSSVVFKFEFLFGLFCCVMFVVPHDNWNNLYAVAAADLFLVLYLFSCAAGHRRLGYPDELGLGFTLFVLSCFLSMLFTADREDSLRILILFIAAFVLCWIIAAGFDTQTSLRRLLGFLYLSLLAVSVYAVLQRVLNLVEFNAMQTDASLNHGVPGRVYAGLDNPNNLSGFLQLFLPLGAAYAAGAKTNFRRFILGAGLLLPAVALVMTYSRSGWLSVMLAAALFVYFCNKRLLPALLILAVLAIPLLPDSVMTRLSTITNSRDTSRNHRLAVWDGVLALLRDKQYWLTGIGLGPEAFKKIYPSYAFPLGVEGAYHSQMQYLELILELGILGLVSFIWMIFKYAGKLGRGIARSKNRENRMVMIACAATLGGLAVSGTVEYLWFYQRCLFGFFIFFGVTSASVRIEAREAAEVEEHL